MAAAISAMRATGLCRAGKIRKSAARAMCGMGAGGVDQAFTGDDPVAFMMDMCVTTMRLRAGYTRNKNRSGCSACWKMAHFPGFAAR
jgi:hypothetical protein